jgi:hypothetical protein
MAVLFQPVATQRVLWPICIATRCVSTGPAPWFFNETVYTTPQPLHLEYSVVHAGTSAAIRFAPDVRIYMPTRNLPGSPCAGTPISSYPRVALPSNVACASDCELRLYRVRALWSLAVLVLAQCALRDTPPP